MSLHSCGNSRCGYLQYAQLFFHSLLRGRRQRLTRRERFRNLGTQAIQVLEDRVLLSGSSIDLDTNDPIVISQQVAPDTYMLYQSHQGTVRPSDLNGTTGGLNGPGGSNISTVIQNQPGTFNIVLNYGPQLALNPAAIAAFEGAASFWETQFSDPITVYIDAEFGTKDLSGASFPANVLGSTGSVDSFFLYSDIRDALIQDASKDESLVNSLPSVAGLTFNTAAGLPAIQFAGQTAMDVNRANAMALGFTNVPGDVSVINSSLIIDASISFNSGFSFDLDSSNGVTSGAYDFRAVALHEIGHALGFVSAVDAVDYYVDNSISTTIIPAPMDLFRLAPGQGGSFSTAPRILNTGAAVPTQVFYDGQFNVSAFAGKPGVSGLTTGDIPMSTGVGVGDGNQASHFKSDDITTVNIGVMDPTLASGVVGVVTRNDLRVLGMIGWDWKDNGAFSTVTPIVTVTPTSTSDTTPALTGTVSESGADVYVRLPALFGNDSATLLADGQLGGTSQGTGSFTLSNSVSSTANIVRMDLLVPGSVNGGCFMTDSSNGDFIALSGAAATGLLSPTSDNSFNDQDVRTRTDLLSLTFSDFNPGESFSWDIYVLNEARTNFVTGDYLIGGLVRITYDNGITVTNTLAAVGGNPTASSTTLTAPHYLATTNDGSTWTLADNLLPALTVGQTYEVQTLIVDKSGAEATDSTSNELVILANGAISLSIVKVTDGTETSTPTNGLFRATLSSTSLTDTIVNYLVGGTATPGAGNDYTTLSGTVTILAGQLTADIVVPVLNDAVVEGTETVVVTPASVIGDPMIVVSGTPSNDFQGLFAPGFWTFFGGPAGSVNTAGAPASISLTSGNVGVAGNSDYIHIISAPGSISFAWSYTTSDSAAADYPQYLLNGVATILPGYSIGGATTQSGTAVIPVNVSDFTFGLRMATTDGNNGAATTVFSNFVSTAYTSTSLNITDNDTATISLAKLLDGVESNTPTDGVFRVTQSAVSSTNTVVNYTISGTAVAGTDYTTLTGSVTILAGQTTADITVAVLNDAILEGTEAVSVTLTSVTGDPQISIQAIVSSGFQGTYATATWFPSTNAGGTFTTNAPTSISLTSGNSSSAGNMDYTHSIPANGTVSFSWAYSTTDGAQWDYPLYLLNGVATILPGYSTSGASIQSGSAVVSVNAGDVFGFRMYTLDGFAGAATTVFSNLSAPANPSASLNITDTDTATVSVAKILDGAETATPTAGKFRVTQSAISTTDTVVNYSIGGTAVTGAGNDYTTLTGTVTITAGQTTADIDVTVLGDARVEATETVILTLSSLGAHDPDISLDAANLAATVNITDDDTATVSLASITNGAETNTPTSGKFRVTQTAISSTDTVVFYSIGGTATPGVGKDYTTLTGSVTITAGQTTADINVTVLNDAIVEGTETVDLTLTGFGAHDSDITLDSVSTNLDATINITDNDTAKVSIAKFLDATEGTTPIDGRFRVTQTAISTTDTVVNYSIAGSATAGGDYATLSGAVTILAGQTTADIDVAVIDDGFMEANETVVVTLTSLGAHDPDIALNSASANLTATVTIFDDDFATFTINNVTANESAGTMTFALATDRALDIDVVIDVTFTDVTAIGGGTDYASTTQHITFLAGQTDQTVTLSLNDDNLVEATETFTATLSTATNLGTRTLNLNDTGTGTITDNDAATFTIDDVSANESTGVLIFNLSTDKAFDITVVVDVTFTGGTATGSGIDYASTFQHITFLAGETTQSVSVPLNNDNVVEATETFTAQLGTGTALGNRSVDLTDTATATILDDDTATFTINDVTVSESAGAMAFTLATSRPLDIDVIVDVTFTDATATGGADYASTVQHITFLAGQTSQTVNVALNNDSVVEASETFTVALGTTTPLGNRSVSLSDTATGLINDNDTATFTLDNVTASEDAGVLVFNLATDKALDIDVIINVTFTNGTATGGGTDYVSTSQQVTLLAGQTSQSVSVTLNDDGLVEASETFTAALSALTVLGSRTVILSDTGTGTITDNDAAIVSITQVADGAETNTPTNGKFRISQTAPSSTNTVVTYSIGGTAISGSDYVALTGTATILAGQTTVDLDVTVFNDAVLEGTETVVVTLLGFGAHDPDITLNGTPASQTATVIITDDDPLVLTGNGTADVVENTPASTVLLVVGANNSLGNSLTMTLTGPDAALFNIDSATGSLTFINSPNFETPLDQGTDNQYHVTVNVTDSLTPTHATSRGLVINVTNENETPTNLALSAAIIAENQPAGTTVATLSTTDPDAGSTFTYGLTSGGGSIDNAYFQLVGNSLRLTQPLNFEAQSTYSIRISSTDSGGLSISKAFTITATDVNETPTALVLSPTTIAENQPVGTTVGLLTSTDPDASDTATYGLVAGSGSTDNGSFQIVGNVLRTTQPLNFEAQAAYTIRVRVTDLGGLNSEKSFTITATNVNETPTDLALSASTVAENQPDGTLVGALSTTDPDSGEAFTYSLVSGTGSADNSRFQIAGTTLRLAQPLNFEAQATYSVRIRTTDSGGLSFENTFTVTATDVNEKPTSLALSTNTVAENQPAGTGIGTLSSTDPDAGDTFTYTLVAGTGSGDNASFQIVGNTLQTAQPLNFEVRPTYSIRIRTTDLGGLTTENTFTITATNVNETPTGLGLAPSAVAENQPAGTGVGTLSGVDPDAGDTFTYTLVAGPGGTDNTLFAIVGNSLRTTQPLNFEAQSAYSILIRTTDLGGLTFDKTFVITATDVNEAPTDLTLLTTTIAESPLSGIQVSTITTADPDAGDMFTYTLVSGSGSTDNAFFQIVGNALRTAQPLNFEAQSTYFIRIRTTDFGGLTFEKTYTITVTDVNEAPTILAVSGNTVPENQPAGTPVGTLSTTDQDAGESFIYTLVTGTGSADNASFKIVGNQLQTAQPLNFEVQSGYAVRIRTTDLRGLTLEKSFTISATNVNEAPINLILSSNTVAENQPAATTVGLLIGTDADAPDTLTYSLVSGPGDTDNSLFQVDGNLLQTVQPLNFEAKSSYSVLVQTTDLAGLTLTRSFTVTVTDVNEAPTGLALSADTVLEKQPAGTVVGTLSSTDPDSGEALTYSLVAGGGSTDNAFFQIVGNSLRTSQPLIFQDQATYSILVRVTDHAGLKLNRSFTITAIRQNAAPTGLALSGNSVAENQNIGTSIGNLTTVDADTDDTFTYALVTGSGSDDNSFFQLVGNTLKTSQSLNFEAQPTYTVRIRTTDSGGLMLEKAFTINATNVNETPAALALSDNTVAENEPANTFIGTLSSTDPDVGDTLTYTLVSGTGDAGNAAFVISGNSLSTSQSLDFETQASYSIRVRTTDAGGLSVDKVFTIQVTDTPDAPRIQTSSGTGTFPNGHSGRIDAGAIVSDQDSTNFINNRIVVTIDPTTIKTPDTLLVFASGRGTDKLKALHGNLLLGKTQLGTVTGGLGGQPLQITFTVDIDAPLVQRVLRQIGLKTQKSAAGVRHIQFQMFDGTGASKPPVVKDVAVGS